jgi:RNA polymerase sigma-70 factor (ECF subfamily)
MREDPSAERRLEPEALEGLLAHRRRLLASLTRWVGSAEDAEDILQQAYLKALGRGGELRTVDSALAWFSRLLRNVAIDHLRHKQAGMRVDTTWSREAERELLARDVETGVCECFHALLPELKPSYAEVLRHVDLGGGDVAQAARTLGTTANNVRVRLHRARAALRTRLLAVCGVCAEHGCIPCTCAGSGT